MAVSDFRKRLDEDLKKQGKKQGENNSTTTDEYDLANRFSTAKKTIAPSVSRDLYNSAENIHGELVNNIYKLGGSERIKKYGMFDAADPMINEAQYYKKLYQANPQFFKQYFGEDTDWERYFTDFKEYDGDRTDYFVGMSDATADLLKETKNIASARTGGLDAIDMTGMPKAQKQELGRAGNLAQRDTVYEKLQQNPDQEYYEHNYGEIFQGMSEKEYLDKLTAYYRNKKSQEAAQKKYDDWKAGADAETAKILAMPEYETNSVYKGGSEYLTPDNAYLEGYDHYTDANGVTLSAKQYREKVVNETLAALVDAGNDPAKLESLRGNIEMLPELNNNDYNYEALPYMTDEQRSAFFTLYNSGKTDAAKDYLRHTLDYGLRKAYVEDSEKQLREDLENANALEKAAYSALTVPINLINEAQGAALAVRGALDPEYIENVHEFDPMFDAARTTQMVRGEVGQDIAEGAKWANIPGTDMNLAQMGYNALMSAGDSALNAFLFGGAGAWAPTTAMGAGAFTSELMESQDYWDALAAGIIEGGSEYIPFDIIGNGAIKPGAKVAYNMLAEALGEGSAEVLNTVYDTIKNGTDSEAGQRMDELITQGYTKKDAILKVIGEKGLDVLESGITGALSGVSAAPKAISEHRADKKTGTNLANNEGKQALADLAETLPVSKQAKDIIARMRAEMSERTKSDKAETEIAEKGGVTKADAEAAARETEMTERDKAERADETKEITEEDAAAVTAEDVEALENAEQTERDKAERAEDGKSVPEQDAASVTAEDVAAVKNKEQAKRDRKENAGKKKGAKAVSKAEIGYLYRETMSKLDKEAQNIVSKNFSRDIRNELDMLGYDGDSKQASEAIAKFAMGEIAPETLDILENSKVARDIALSYVGKVDYRNSLYDRAYGIAQRASKDYVKPESTKAEKGAQEATQGIDYRAAISAEDIEVSDVPESTVDGKAVTIEGVASVAEDGSVTYTVKDADGNVSEVSEADVAYGQNDAGIAAVAQNAKELGANADSMLKAYNSEQNAAEYSAAFKQAVQYGDDGRNLDVIKNDSALSTLTEQQIEIAYNIGRGVRTGRNDAMVRKNASGVKVGQVDISGVDFKRLTKHQRTSVHAMSRLAKAAGFNIRFVESKANAEGKYATENGSWDPETLTLTLDVHAGVNKKDDVSYAMMHTAGHELTHYIRQFADTDMWNAYQEFVIGHLSTKEDGVFNLEDRINKRIEGARKKGRNLTRDGAIEEIIANASGEALNSISEADIQALAETNPSLLNKVKQFFQRWIKSVKAAIKAAYSDTEAKTAEAKMMMDAVDEMGKRWNELFVNAAKNRAAENVASETTIEGVEVSESGDTAYAGTDLLYDLRTFNESDYVTERDKAAAALAKKMGITTEKAESYIDDVTGIAAMVAKDRDRLDFESEDEYTALKHNSEYKFTVDFSTLCKKRLLYTGTFDAIQKQMPETALTEDDYIRLRQMMADRGYEVACAFCYVESRRKNNGEIINKFLDVYKEAQKTGGQMELGPSNRRKAFKVEDGFTPNIADFNTSEGIANIMHNHRGVYGAYMYFMNARGVSKPKLIESRTAYNSEILKKFRSASAVKAMNRRGGLRLQSFSDFEVVNMLDMMQVVMDMSRVGLMSQAYTKVPAFARAFGDTGVKINLSLVTKGVDKNGKLIFDDIEGMPHEEAFKIRDMYSENVGTILVGKDDETIRAAMADPRIDFIIPYHASGWSTENQNALGIGGYTNFTAGQNETNAATGKGVKNFQPSEYWDYSKTGDENAQTYLKKCREAGRVPKFPQYQNYPGYWKMLIDFKMYDNEGNGSPQRAVRPDFNLSEAGRIMKEYTGGHQNLPVAHDVVRDFVKEYEGKQDGKKYSDREDIEFVKTQERDFSELSDRELLVQALETELTPAERDHLERYKTKVDELGEDQGKLEKLTSRIVELKNAGYTAKTSEELRVAETNATTLRRRIDREDAKLKEIESAAMIKEVIKRNREAARKQAYTLARQRADERQRKAVEHAREVGERRVQRLKESQGKEKYKKRILEDVKKLHTWVASPTNKGSVPEFLREPLAEFIDSIDFRSQKALSAGKALETGAAEEWLKQATQRRDNAKARYDKALAEYEEIKKTGTDEQIKKAKRKMRLAKGTYEIEARAVEQGIEASAMEYTAQDKKFTEALDKVREAVSKLNKQYAGLDSGAEAFAGFVDLTGDFAEEFDKLVRDIKDTLGRGRDLTDTPLNRMNAQQLKELSQMFKVLRTSIRQMNMNLANSRYESNRTMSRDGIDELGEMKARTKTNKALELLNSTFNWKNTTPYYAFERLGRAGKAVFEALQDGWDKMARNSTRVINYAKETFNEQESKAWSGEIDTIELDSGETVQMTTAQKMSLYCHTKREQSRGHLMGGGIRMSDIDGKHGSKITQTEDYVLTENDIANIIDSLTDRQKEVADKLQRFMNTVCAEWGNEISMKRFGFEQMTEKNYFPIKTDSNNRASIDEDKDGRTSMFRLLNMSSLKPLTPGANNAIIIEDIFNVFSDHASDMAKYNALALPILDFIKWYNYVERNDIVDESGNPTGKYTTRSTQKSLERVFGKDAKEYLRAFIKDLNAEHDGGRNDGLINNIVGKAKSAAVGANLRVYALQVTSLPRAAYVINPKYLVAGAAKLKNLNPVNAIKGTEAQEKVGILQWKKLGFYSTDINRSTREMIKRNEGWLGKIRDWQMAPAGWGDNLVSNIIYEAAKAEMQDKHSDIREGTAEYDYMLNKRVREIVYKTQVVDSTMTRSDLMRSKGLASMITAFMSEPTLTVNMLSESIHKAVELGRKGGNTGEILRATGGLAVRAASTWVTASVVTTLMESVFDALRDDDEYEKFYEKFWNALWGDKWYEGNFVQNLNPVTMFPILNDAWSIMIEGYEDNSLIMQVFSQFKSFFDAIGSYKKGNTTLYNVIYKGVQTVSSMSGVGAANAARDGVALYNTFFAPAWNTPKAQTYQDSASTAANAYYGALKENRAEDAAYYKRRMEVDGIDQAKVADKVATLIGDDYVAGNITEANARKWLDTETALDDKKIDTKMRDLNFKAETGVNYGDFKSAYLAGTISKTQAQGLLKKYCGYDDNKVYFTLLEWEGGEGWSRYDAFLDAVDAQRNFAAEAKKLLDHGVDKSDIASAIASAYKDAYRQIHGTAEGNRLLEYLLDVYESIGYDRDYERKYITKNWIKD